MESFATPYPVIFNDGEQDNDKGLIGIHSCLTFKRFQSMVGQKTGLPSAQLSTVFVCKRTVGGAEKRQKLPINENTNFAIIISQHHSSREKDCYFLVAMKRSKKDRKVIKKRVEADPSEDVLAEKKDDADAEKAEPEKVDCPQTPEAKSPEQRKPEHPERVERPDLQPETEAPPKQEAAGAASQPSAWKKGSLVQRLSSLTTSEDKARASPPPSSPRPHLAEAPVAAPVVPLERLDQGRVVAPQEKPPATQPPVMVPPQHLAPVPAQHAVPVPAQHAVPVPAQHAVPVPAQHQVVKMVHQVTGMVSPTSVLDPSGSLRPAMASPVSPANLVSPGVAPNFSLFGPDVRGMYLRTLLEEAAANDMSSKRPKHCKFCAFCRERNMAAAPFHWCVDDQVVSGFRGPNPAGPIGARAVKQRVAAA